VDWNTVCRSKEVGGLGLRRIKEFNNALLGKWGLRMLIERESLWFKVLSARYGLEEGRVKGGGREASWWWRDVHVLCSEAWFRHNVSRVLGNGKNTWFWSEVWVGDVPLRDKFPRLFELSLVKDMSVFDMCLLGWGWMVGRGRGGGDSWRGRRRCWGN